jgi:xylulokinase
MSLGGLDVGTTMCRLIVFDESGRILTSAYREYPLITDHDQIEIDPTHLWSSVCDVCREASSKVPNDPIEAIGVSAMGDTLIPTNSDFTPLGNAILAFDMRSKKQNDNIIGQLGFERIHRITGMPAHPMNTASKILWRQESTPVGKKGTRYMCTEDFVIAKLTGNPVMSYSMAGRTMMFDVSARCWWSNMLECIGIKDTCLSAVTASATAAGRVSKSIVEELGLSEKVLIVTAGHDQICSAVGSGAVQDGMVADNTGTFECVIAGVGEERRKNIDLSILAHNNLAFYSHGSVDLWAAFAWFNAGSVINWCRDNLFSLERERARETGEDVYEIMFANLDDEVTGVRFLPHLTGTGTPWLNPNGKGALVGVELATDKHDILRAVVEGIGCDLMLNFERFKKAGIHIDEIRATGGGARSATWVQQKADMTGRTVTVVQVPEASALGAAICAGTAVGCCSSIVEGSERMVVLGKTYEPNMKQHEQFRDKTKRHLELYNTMVRYLENR